ncbi:hypothetical protein SNEBB_004322 [Seison nebaliae]|nr:hypothetical protein SNEBB_004322 [Seison nebaliae]
MRYIIFKFISFSVLFLEFEGTDIGKKIIDDFEKEIKELNIEHWKAEYYTFRTHEIIKHNEISQSIWYTSGIRCTG